jgi:hypothetical protein
VGLGKEAFPVIALMIEIANPATPDLRAGILRMAVIL